MCEERSDSLGPHLGSAVFVALGGFFSAQNVALVLVAMQLNVPVGWRHPGGVSRITCGGPKLLLPRGKSKGPGF